MADITIPQFTKEDYLNGCEPYEFLYNYRNNKFLLSQ